MDPTTDQLFLLKNIKSLDGSQFVPSKLSIDTTAFSIFTSQQGNVVAAGSFLKKGKIVVVGHEAIVNRYDCGNPGDDSPQFTQNIIRWLARGKEAIRIGMLVEGKYDGFRKNMTTTGYSLNTADISNLPLFDVLFADTYTEFTEAQLSEIETFVSGGGGLLVGGQNWHLKKERVNNILRGSGIIVTDVQSDGNHVFIPNHPSPSTSAAGIINGELDLGQNNNGSLILFEKNAFSIVNNERGVIVAGAHYEMGRMVHIARYAVINNYTTPTETRLVENIIGWLTRMKQATSIGILGKTEFRKTMINLGHTVQKINADDDLSSYSLLCTTTYEEHTEEELQKIHSFVATGGGLLTTGKSINVKLHDLLKPGGMCISKDDTAGGTIQVNSKTPESQDLLNAFHCIKSLISHVKKERSLSLTDQQDIAVTVRSASVALPQTYDEFWRIGKEFLQLLQPVPISSPLDTKAFPVKASYVYIFNAIVESEDVETMKSYPEAKVFPGEVPSILQPLSKSIEVDATYPGLPDYCKSHSTPVWRSTGLYAAPSVPIIVTVPPKAINQGLHVLIGCHTDTITKHDRLSRYPRVTRFFEIRSSVSKAANVFGGLIYITVPAGLDLGKMKVSIDNGYAVPEFVLGKTDDDDWKKSVSDNPIPFCELISENIILTVKTYEATNIVKSPTELMKIYHACLDAINELCGIKHRARGERIVHDEQLNYGYAHAGYPIMAKIKQSQKNLGIAKIVQKSIWVPLHEIGHQYQLGGWSPAGGLEGTCDIFAVYASEKVLNLPSHEIINAACNLSPTARKERIDKYIKKGRKYEDWRGDTALETYLQLQEAFGWDFFIKIIGEYNQDMANRPKSNQQRVDEWMRRSSRITGFNLGPFYEGWGWPVSQEALQDIASLPHWDQNPMPLN